MRPKSRSILLVVLFSFLLLALGVSANADPLDSWHVRYPASFWPDDLNSVAFGNNTFVAVGESGAILTSQDTHRWVRRMSPVGSKDIAIRSVTFANNIFVAVGARGTILTSPNGFAWKKQRSGIPGGRDEYDEHWLSCVTFGNGKFVAVGSSGIILTSPDAVKWKKVNAIVSTDLYGVTFGNGMFVAVGYNGVILTSPDGGAWTQQASPDTSWLFCVTYGNGTFVATGDRIFTSLDGITWTPKNPTLSGRFYGAAFGSNTFIVVGSNGIMTSPDGDTWAVSRDAYWFDSFWNGVAFANDTFVVVGWADQIATSPDATTWSLRRPQITIEALSSVTYGQDRFVAVGISFDRSGLVATSPDGVTWTQGVSATAFSLIDISYGNNTFVAVGSGGTILASGDGITWVQIPSVTSYDLYGITFGNNRFVAVGLGGYTLVSSDGMTWTQGNLSTECALNSVTYGNNTFVAVGNGGSLGRAILTSPDGMTWTPSVSPARNELTSVAFGNNTFVAVGYEGIFTSPDGITWSQGMITMDFPPVGVAHGNNTFVVVGDCGQIFTSSDGLSWTPREWEYYRFGCYDLGTVTFGNNTFLAVGYAGQWGPYIVQSDPVGGEYYDLTVSSSGLGTVTSLLPGIDCGRHCSETFFQKTQVTLLATPDLNSVFTGWTGCDLVDGYFCTVIMNNAKNVSAGFITVDFTGPTLSIKKPSGKPLTEATALVSGTATDSKKGNNGIIQVMVNGEKAMNDTAEGKQKAKWSATVPLELGDNIITVAATDGAGNTTTITRSVTRLHESLAISTGIAQNN